MKYQLVTILCNFVMLLLLKSFTLHAAPTPTTIPSNITINNCSRENYDPTEGNLLYSLSELFNNTTATLKDVEAFKYYCINHLIVSTIKTEMVSIIIILYLQPTYVSIVVIVFFEIL